MTKKERAAQAVRVLKERYPDALCSLVYEKPYELMIAARLSAQCTDARVNIVTGPLFRRYPTLEAFAQADLAELETLIRPCGFYRTKAASIKAACERLLTVYDGVIPDNMDDLLTLPGIGRKTANLLLGDVYGKPAVVADTHFIRITGRLGLTKQTEPEKVEAELRRLLPPEESSDFCHRVVLFGRDVCSARKPKCSECPMADFCPGCRG
ncbi:MAG: endonuclease III [Oscillospiraceae bacterium]|nr:endonuclease III [Oscillospiraceae bacterium]MBR1459448.1 endonuclease III [Oscillospiraceae bacterium]MBR1897433.1 endonuclease III [Oscillospiraceae bacterium]